MPRERSVREWRGKRRTSAIVRSQQRLSLMVGGPQFRSVYATPLQACARRTKRMPFATLASALKLSLPAFALRR